MVKKLCIFKRGRSAALLLPHQTMGISNSKSGDLVRHQAEIIASMARNAKMAGRQADLGIAPDREQTRIPGTAAVLPANAGAGTGTGRAAVGPNAGHGNAGLNAPTSSRAAVEPNAGHGNAGLAPAPRPAPTRPRCPTCVCPAKSRAESRAAKSRAAKSRATQSAKPDGVALASPGFVSLALDPPAQIHRRGSKQAHKHKHKHKHKQQQRSDRPSCPAKAAAKVHARAPAKVAKAPAKAPAKAAKATKASCPSAPPRKPPSCPTAHSV